MANIGNPLREIEVEPLSIPIPTEIPQSLPQQEPARRHEEEPAPEIPVGV